MYSWMMRMSAMEDRSYKCRATEWNADCYVVACASQYSYSIPEHLGTHTQFHEHLSTQTQFQEHLSTHIQLLSILVFTESVIHKFRDVLFSTQKAEFKDKF